MTFILEVFRFVEKYEPRGIRCVVGSAQAEVFLKNAKRKGFVKYLEGGENFTSLKEELEDIKFRRSRGEDVDAISAATAEKNALVERLRTYLGETSRNKLLEKKAQESEYLQKDFLSQYDVVVISDYNKGFLTEEDIEKI